MDEAKLELIANQEWAKQLKEYWYELLVAVREFHMANQTEKLMLYNMHLPFWQNVSRQRDIRDKVEKAMEHLEAVLLKWPLKD